MAKNNQQNKNQQNQQNQKNQKDIQNRLFEQCDPSSKNNGPETSSKKNQNDFQ